ncbi:MAG: response regulator [Planctomycetales bacterium]|nr:response regulator [Planctomycetales bacterium]
MHQILVVDDCVDSRRLAGAVLQSKVPDAEVRFAKSAEEALEAIAQAPPDIVVTDVMMSGMSGLELVEQLRSTHPTIPVIVVTAYGSEDAAVQALQKGAASYVPKRDIVQQLGPVVLNVLELAHANRNRQRVISCLTFQVSNYVLNNDTSLVPPLVGLLQEQLIRSGFGDGSERVRLGVGLHEALMNAIQHGNLELNSDLRQDDESIYYNLSQERRRTEPYASRRVFVTVKETPSEIRYVIRDQGPGFKPKQTLDPTDEANLERIGGRGLLLIQSFYDEARHNEAGNQITLVRHRPGAPLPTTTESEAERCTDEQLDFIDEVTESPELAVSPR